jgi:hypothetical protein
MEIIIILYLLNSLFLILHQIDGAYWNEWKLFFNKKEGINGYLWFNLIALAVLLYGFTEVVNTGFSRAVFSGILAVVGIATFMIHSVYFIKGEKDFTTPFSIFILAAILVVSIIQAVYSIILIG